ncbi:MAG: HNH endonuclease [Bacteroidetes bacterium]|nr:HNH endonuclease [Bacteroidota bacterium]
MSFKGYYECYYCGHRGNATSHRYEHRIPKSWGLKDSDSLIVDACRQCNDKKRAMDYLTFASWILQNNWSASWPDANMERFIREVMRVLGMTRKQLREGRY